ncbi:MAG TPA: NADH-quinone oxidoreductase subunit M [Chitinophagales bacterium]|nr:NADH-quinone oxidoreductase subunit M [Chitinophagales bacterium]
MLLIALLFIPLAFSLITYLSGDRYAKYVALAGGAAAFVACNLLKAPFIAGALAPLTYAHNWISNPVIQFSLSLDGLSFMLVALTSFLVPLIIFTTYGKAIDNAKAFYALILLMEFGLLGVFLADDGFLFYIFWELALIPIFFIALLWGENQDKDFRNRAIFKFFVYTLAGSLFMLVGFIYLYQQSGSFSTAALYALNLSPKEQGFLFWAFFLAFAIKIPVFPFHTWQPDTYKEAPTAGTMLLAGIMLKMGLYGLLRWLLPVLPEGVMLWTPLVIVLATIGVIYGSVIAIKQDDLKKLLAYSSFAHVGLITAGIFTLTREGFQGAAVQMFAHGFNVVGLFFAAEIILRRTGTLSISQLGGIRNVAPKFAACFVIVVLASVALPTTNAFIGEFLLLFGVYEYNTWLAVIAGLTIILGAVYMLRMYQNVMLGETNALTAGFADLNWQEMLVFILIIIGIFQVGLYPKQLMDMMQPSLDFILNNSLK